MKKKLTILLTTIACLLLLASCGSSKTASYGGKTKSELKNEQQKYADQLLALSADELKQYSEYFAQQAKETQTDKSAEMTSVLLKNWIDVSPSVGDFIKYTDFKVDVAGKTVTCTLNMDFSKRDARMVFVYNKNTMKTTAMNFEPVYTKAETMSKAALNVLMGMITVFCVLIIISVFIYAFRIIPYIQKKLEGNSAAPSQAGAPAAAPAVSSKKEDLTDDLELVAVITAAIAAGTGASTDSFVVRSIKRRY
ncbi:MAG: OadG family protein [Lachnospiraceae bacterium]|nr:OadG family protein [Lachnospiraceae bacterium]